MSKHYVTELDAEDVGCRICGASTDWEQCPDCGGDGWTDRYEEDPNWYATAPEWERYPDCDMCNGEGGWVVCLGGQQHADAVLAKIAEKEKAPRG